MLEKLRMEIRIQTELQHPTVIFWGSTSLSNDMEVRKQSQKGDVIQENTVSASLMTSIGKEKGMEHRVPKANEWELLKMPSIKEEQIKKINTWSSGKTESKRQSEGER